MSRLEDELCSLSSNSFQMMYKVLSPSYAICSFVISFLFTMSDSGSVSDASTILREDFRPLVASRGECQLW